MIKFENTEVIGWEAAIRGMRNPMNSWERQDSYYYTCQGDCEICSHGNCQLKPGVEGYVIGPNDQVLAKRLVKGGKDHAKFMRMLHVQMDVTAPLYWWKEYDTYKVATVSNSCSTMHKIHAKEFTLDDFSCEHLFPASKEMLKNTIELLNAYREDYINKECGFYHDKDVWWQMIQLLPSSYNQKRTLDLNYATLREMYFARRNHKLDEWKEHNNIDIETLKRYYDGDYKLRDEKNLNDIGFCDWIKTLPYSELITMEQ